MQWKKLACRGSRGIAPLICDVGTRWNRWVVNFTPCLLCPGKEPQVSVEEVGHRISLDILEKREISCLCQELKPRSFSTWHCIMVRNKAKGKFTSFSLSLPYNNQTLTYLWPFYVAQVNKSYILEHLVINRDIATIRQECAKHRSPWAYHNNFFFHTTPTTVQANSHILARTHLAWVHLCGWWLFLLCKKFVVWRQVWRNQKCRVVCKEENLKN